MRRKILSIAILMTASFGSFAQTPNNILAPIGNVGIGTLSPTSKLQVVGNSVFTGNLNLTGNSVFNGTTTISQLKLTGLSLPTNASGLQLVVLDQATGTVSKAGSDILKDLVYAEPYVPCLAPVDFSGNPLPISPVWANGPSKLFVRCPQDVKVGIGTSNPVTKLDVDGNVRATQYLIGMAPIDAQALVHVRLNEAPSNSKLFIYENASGRLLQLDNKGMLRAREIKVDVANWSDYVFDEDYKLLTPAEIKAYIEANHHLPGVPSAAEMEEVGMNVMETSATLLKKIEELTLLLIQQQEQIDALTKQTTK